MQPAGGKTLGDSELLKRSELIRCLVGREGRQLRLVERAVRGVVVTRTGRIPGKRTIVIITIMVIVVFEY